MSKKNILIICLFLANGLNCSNFKQEKCDLDIFRKELLKDPKDAYDMLLGCKDFDTNREMSTAYVLRVPKLETTQALADAIEHGALGMVHTLIDGDSQLAASVALHAFKTKNYPVLSLLTGK